MGFQAKLACYIFLTSWFRTNLPKHHLPPTRESLAKYDYSVASLIKRDVKRLYHHVTCHKVSWAHLDVGMDPQVETKYRRTWILQQN